MNQKMRFIFFIIISFLVWYFVWKIIKYAELKKERKKSVKKSRSIILWESFEALAPFMPDISYHPKDMNFLWKWVDYIVFDGLANWKLKQIVFLEIKTWKSCLNTNEKQIKKIIEKWKIKYELKYYWKLEN